MIIKVNEDNYDINILYNKYFNVDLNFSDPFKKVYVYIINNKVIGFIDYSLIYDRIELNYILVIDEYRLSKIASKLIEKMLEESVDSISLEVCINNDAAIKLYKKYGFNIVSIRKNYYDGLDAYLMHRKS